MAWTARHRRDGLMDRMLLLSGVLLLASTCSLPVRAAPLATDPVAPSAKAIIDQNDEKHDGLSEMTPQAQADASAKPASAAIGSWQLLLRNYSEYLSISPGTVGATSRQAWVQSARLAYRSGYSHGDIGLGVDVSLYSAVKFNGGIGAGNMVYVGDNGHGSNRTAWAYLGEYMLKAKLGSVLFKYGLQETTSPYLDPYDIRALPPTFRGLSAEVAWWPELNFKAGSFERMNARGANYLQPLATSYGGVGFERLSYVGVHWSNASLGQLTLYTSRAKDIWNQNYVSVSRSVGDAAALKWTCRVDGYLTKAQGRAGAGPIDNHSYSLAISAQHRATSVTLAYQKIGGEQFFDYLQETSGIYLANAMGVDYNAPHERSVQLRYDFDGNTAGLPGFKVFVWGIRGSGADGSAGAARYRDPGSLLHELYWSLGRPVNGRHHELGLKPTYTVQGGTFKDTKLSLSMVAHRQSVFYPSKSFNNIVLTVEKLFTSF